MITLHQDIKSSRAPYFEDIWNWYDWLAYFFMFITSVMVLTTLHGQRYLEVSLITSHLHPHVLGLLGFLDLPQHVLGLLPFLDLPRHVLGLLGFLDHPQHVLGLLGFLDLPQHELEFCLFH